MQVVQPLESTARPFAHMRFGQLTVGHVEHTGGCQAHLPSVPRVHVALVIGPEQVG
jgi:hypothetical protein